MNKKDFINREGFIIIDMVLSREVCTKIQEELKRDGFSTYLANFLLDLGIRYDEFEDTDDFYQELANILDDTFFVNEDNVIYTFWLLKDMFIDQIKGLDYYDEYDCDLSFSDFLCDYDIYKSEY